MKRKSSKSVAIIGGGISGLVCAYNLSKKGYRAIVFEKSAKAGGRMSSQIINGITFDSGANFFAKNYLELKSLAKNFKIPWRLMKRNSRHRIVRDHKPRLLRLTPTGLLRLDLLSPLARMRLLLWLAKIMFSPTNGDFFYLSTIKQTGPYNNAYEHLAHKVHKEVADYLADAFTSLMQFHRASKISSSMLETFMKMLISPKEGFEMRYTPARIDRIIKALTKVVTIRHNQKVKLKICQRGIDVKSGKNKECFDACVIATPAPQAKLLLKNKLYNVELFNYIEYAKTIVVGVAIDAKYCSPDIKKIHLTYVPYRESKLIGGYTNEARKPGASLDTRLLFNFYFQEEATKRFLKLTDKQIFQKTLKEIPYIFPEIKPVLNRLELLKIKRWKYAMPKFTADHLDRVKSFEKKLQGKQGVYLCGDYMNAPWTEGSARSGKRVAQLIHQNFERVF